MSKQSPDSHKKYTAPALEKGHLLLHRVMFCRITRLLRNH